ncbi:MAG: hypothetical protein J0M08_10910 [Bacteroidetes bacterium]|nr:hypothetical protein [Bacteroidota bacterium]
MFKLLYKTTAIFLLVTVFIYTVSKFDNLQTPNDFNIARVQSLPTSKLDVLFIGPSFSYCGINTPLFDSITELNSYNLGVASAGVNYYELLLANFLSTHAEYPTYIFFNVTPITFCENSDAWNLYPIHRYLTPSVSNEYLLFNDYISFHDFIKLIRKSFFKSVQTIFNTNSADVSAIAIKKELMKKNKGYSPNNSAYNNLEEKENEQKYTQYKKYSFDEEKYKRFIQLLKRCKDAGITPVVHETPTFELKKFYSENYINDYNKKLLLLSSYNVTYLIKEPIEMNNKNLFASIDHLNTVGANIYTNYLSKEFIKQINTSK